VRGRQRRRFDPLVLPHHRRKWRARRKIVTLQGLVGRPALDSDAVRNIPARRL